MKDQFLPYEYSEMLKELGFKDQCFMFYSGNGIDANFIRNTNADDDYVLIGGSSPQKGVSAPLYQQAEQWLWEKHHLRIAVYRMPSAYSFDIFKEEIGEKKIAMGRFTCYHPITAKQEGVRQTIEYLYKN